MHGASLCLEILRGEVYLSAVQDDSHRESSVQVDVMEYGLLTELDNEHEVDLDMASEGGKDLAKTYFVTDQWSPRRFARSTFSHDGLQGSPQSWSRDFASISKSQHVLQR